jgi:hypothetical protein
MVLLAPLLCWASSLRPAAVESAEPSITAADLRAHVEFLAADSLAGRDTGEPGIARAEAYIAEKLESFGLAPPPGRPNHYLEFGLHRSTYDEGRTLLSVTVGDREVQTRGGRDFRPFEFSDDGVVEAGVVFAGYGITAPDQGHDDYAGLDVSGKIVLVLRHGPREDDPERAVGGTPGTEHEHFLVKADNALAHGARAMLLVTDPFHHEGGEDLRMRGTLDLQPPGPDPERPEPIDEPDRFLAAQISRPTAETLVGSSGLSLAGLQRAVDSGRRPSELALGNVRARLAIATSDELEHVPARNVVAYLEGTDPDLRDQWILIGAHHDHVGAFEGEGDTVFNGADDNASGTAGVLELAEAFARRARGPRRSLLFVTFTGEERGLLGSRQLLADGRVPVGRVVFMLNLDMIGRNPDRAVEVYGDGYVRGLRTLIEAENTGRLDLEFAGTRHDADSDHHPFYERDVPFAFFFSGTHADYHRVGDHPDKLDYERMRSIVRLAYTVVDELADADAPPRFVHDVAWLGVRLEVSDGASGRPTATITAIETGSPAAREGLRSGDVLSALDDRKLDPGDLGARLRAIEPGTRMALTVLRGTAEQRVRLRRPPPGYLGILPAPVQEAERRAHGLGENEGLVLRRVMPDGPAGKAGLREGDIVVRIGGMSVDTANLRERLAQLGAGATVSVRVIRDREQEDLGVTLGQRPRELH